MLATDFSGPTDVVTHHAPCERSVPPQFGRSIQNPSFASDLTRLMGPPIQLWIHGHMHNSFDYEERGTRVVCNPRGYFTYEPNPDFDPSLTFEVTA